MSENMAHEITLQATVIFYRRKKGRVLPFSIFRDREKVRQEKRMICKGS